MKVLFYLPVVTPWWFDNVVEPMIRRFSGAAEVHVLAPQTWNGTGIGSREVLRCGDLPDVRWSIMDGADHPTTRTRPADADGLAGFVQSLAPDYVICRSADCDTVRHFPGQVRFLMEAGAAPFALPPQWAVLQNQPFDHGMLPELGAADAAWLETAIAPAWQSHQDEMVRSTGDRKAMLSRIGIDPDKRVLFLPLEYVHPENFFLMHRVGGLANHDMVAEIARALPDNFVLALTNHPLNVLHTDNTPLESVVASLRGRVVMASGEIGGSSASLALARHADGMVIGDSKSFALAAFCGTPMLRRSRFATGAWLNASSDLDAFVAAIADGSAAAPDAVAARRWFALHLFNDAFDPADPDLPVEAIVGRIDRPVDPSRWESGRARMRSLMPELFQ